MDNKQILISIVTVVYNGDAFLRRSIDSVIAQDYPYKEHVILDGGSTDGTLAILQEYDKNIAFWKSERDKGIYDAMNKALPYCKGDYVIFLNADDYFASDDVLSKLVAISADGAADGVCGRVRLVDAKGGHLHEIATLPHDKFAFLMHQGFMYKKAFHAFAGEYDITYKVNADYDFYLRLLNENRKFVYTDILVANMQTGGVSSQFAYLTAAETLHIHLKNKLNVRKALSLFGIKILKIWIKGAMIWRK